MDIYLISGLGADNAIFRNLTFSKAENIHHLDWMLLKRTNPKFSKRAIDSIMKWDRTEAPPGLIRIHEVRIESYQSEMEKLII